jgi:hypothetical protein
VPTSKSKPGPRKPRGKPARAPSPRRPASPDAKAAPADPPRSALELAYDVLQHPQEWLRTVNSQFGGRRPIDLIGTEEEVKVYNLLRAADLGLF